MERSVRYSNFAGLSGVVGGVAAVAGLLTETRACSQGVPFILHWSLVLAAALTFDLFWTSRRVRNKDKAVLKRLARRMAMAAMPGLLAGFGLTVAFTLQGRCGELFPYWAILYGVAMASVGLMAPREVLWLGRAFLVAGLIGLMLQVGGARWIGMPTFALTFGLMHVAYGAYIGVREGW